MPLRLSPLLRLVVFLAATVATATVARAELRLPAVFGDHMVLQRDARVPVWGTADAGAVVTVAFAGQKKSATAAADGRWRVDLDPLAVSAAGRELTVSATLNAKTETQKISDILVGEVWLGSGQSNMAMTVNRCADYEKEQAAAHFPLIRHYREASRNSATPQTVGEGKWELCAPATVGGFSGTLYFFGRELHRTLGVPVGLVNSSVGGTPIEAWIDTATQTSDPALKAATAALAANPPPAPAPASTPAPAPKKAARKAAATTDDAAKQAPAKAPAKAADATAPKTAKTAKAAAKSTEVRSTTGGLFNGKIVPLIPFAIRGALWYQGEANTVPAKAPLYQHQLPLLIRDWRARWGYDFPFAWVQLPGFTAAGRDWPPVREAMLKTLSVPKTGMAITMDVGEATDIHPKNKQAVGHRLALWALGTVYAQKVPAVSGPLPAGHEVRGRELVLRFSHANGGLVATGGGELQGFVVAGADKTWHPATARIVGDTVVVSSPAVAAPVAARYAWANLPTCTLANAAGLPASPFRTDDWK